MRTIPGMPHISSGVISDIAGEYRLTQVWARWLSDFVASVQERMPITGTVTFSGTSTAVTFTTPEPDTDYDIFYAMPENRAAWTTGKATTGFTANVSAASTATYGWTRIRR